jgi:hypothetical protein
MYLLFISIKTPYTNSILSNYNFYCFDIYSNKTVFKKYERRKRREKRDKNLIVKENFVFSEVVILHHTMSLDRQLKLMPKTIQIDLSLKHTTCKVENYKLHFDITTICCIRLNLIQLTLTPRLTTST